MKKALKILKILKKEGFYLETNWIDKKGIAIDKAKINEAIQELESLQNRNCSNCKHTDDKYFDLFCINPDVINQHNHLFENGQSMYDNFKVSATFCCNKWNPKYEKI